MTLLSEKDPENRKSSCLILYYSYHHHNTQKVAQAMGEVLAARLCSIDEITVEEVEKYDFIGFGGGIDSGKHYQPLLDYVTGLQDDPRKSAFIFSTSAVMGEGKVRKDHACLRGLLANKGYKVLDEFACKGYNTNSVLKFVGGMNKGRPSEDDLELARKFAKGLLNKSSENTVINHQVVEGEISI